MNYGCFEPIFDSKNAECAYDIFEKIFLSILDKHASLQVLLNRNHYVPYINHDQKVLMNQRNQLKEIASKSDLVDDFLKYREKRNLVSSKLKQGGKDYFK